MRLLPFIYLQNLQLILNLYRKAFSVLHSTLFQSVSGFPSLAAAFTFSCAVFQEREGTSRKREIYEKPPKGRGCLLGNVVLIGYAG